MKRATGRRSMVPQSRPSEDGEVNKHRARPNALGPPKTFQPNGQAGQFSPTLIMWSLRLCGVVLPVWIDLRRSTLSRPSIGR